MILWPGTIYREGKRPTNCLAFPLQIVTGKMLPFFFFFLIKKTNQVPQKKKANQRNSTCCVLNESQVKRRLTCGYFILTITDSITHPLKLSLFHISRWSIGVLNRKIYHLYISNLKPIYEETDVYNTKHAGLFSNLSRKYCEWAFVVWFGVFFPPTI